MSLNLHLPDDTKTKAELCLPIIIGQETVGVLDIQSLDYGAFDDGDVVAIEALADRIAVAIDNARLYDSLHVELAERQQREDQLRQLSRAVEQSPATIVITDLDGRIEYVNPQFSKVTGYSFDEVLEENPRLLKSGHTTPAEYEILWETITNGREWHGEFHNRKKNGELYWESASISPIIDDNGVTTHYLAVKEDITARKQMENALQRRNSELLFINRVSRSMISFLEIEHILQVMLEELRSLWDVTAGLVWMVEGTSVEGDSGNFVCHQITEPYREEAANWRLPAGAVFWGGY